MTARVKSQLIENKSISESAGNLGWEEKQAWKMKG